MDPFTPTAADRFTFGLWTVGNPGRDPFGDPVRPVLDPCYLVERLAACGAYGVNLHDNDLVPFGASAGERDRIVRDFKQACGDHGLAVPMATTNLFGHPVFKDGAFTASDARVRAFALQKTMRAIDLGAELGAKTYVFWGGREGAEVEVCRDGRDALKWFRECLDILCAYVREQDYGMRFALEPKPNEPRGDIYLPTVGHMLHFISTLDDPDMVGVNPEVAHETMAGLSFSAAVAQAMECGKLFHIDLNGQRIGRYDQDLRFGSEDLKQAFQLVRLLEGCAGYPAYEGPLHFDAHAYRSEDEAGVWDFAVGCMRSYKILKHKAAAFDADAEVQEILAAAKAEPQLAELLAGDRKQAWEAVGGMDFDVDGLAARGLRYERLDQLLFEHLTGVRS